MKLNKKICLLLIISLFCVALNVNAISFNLEIEGEFSVEKNESINLKAEYIVGNDVFIPGEETSREVERKDVSKEVKWVSSDPTIAKVDSNGKVTGLRYGEVIITASYDIDDTNRVTSHNLLVTDLNGDSNEIVVPIEEEKNNYLVYGAVAVVICFAAGVVVFVISKNKKTNKRKSK